MSCSNQVRVGFTLTELVVVIAIIAVLMGLIIPAVHRVRESANRTQCGNRLRQIGIAVHNYHTVNSVFPAGVRARVSDTPYSSWLTALLPYVEQQALWTRTQDAYRQEPYPFRDPPHVGLATVVPAFVCPSDPRSKSLQTATTGVRVAFSDYLGVSGIEMKNPNGVLFLESKVRLTDVIDGASNTLMAGERPPGPDFDFGWWYAGVGLNGTGTCDAVLGVRERNNGQVGQGHCGLAAFHFMAGGLDEPCDTLHFWSLHPGGAHFLFCDGSVRFLTYAADSVLPALATRAGGEVVTIPD